MAKVELRTQELNRVSALTEQDCKTWRDNFKKCSDCLAGHDGSRGRNRTMSEPDELLKDVQALDAWVRDLRQRQKAI